MNRILQAAVTAGLLLLLSVPGAAAGPVPPFSPYGTVKVEAANVPEGTEVSAWCDGVRYRSTQAVLWEGESWYFNLDVPGDDPETLAKDGCYIGETVCFKIGELWANETAAWTFDSPRLDLTAQPPIRYLYLPLIWRQ